MSEKLKGKGRYLSPEGHIQGLICLMNKLQSDRWSCLAVQPVLQNSRQKESKLP